MSDAGGAFLGFDVLSFAYLALAVLTIETAVIFSILQKRRLRLAQSILLNGLSGICLMGALLTALYESTTLVFVCFLAASLVAHALDLRLRLAQIS